MGKIYDALKRAEEEAQSNKRKQQSAELEPMQKTSSLSGTENISVNSSSTPMHMSPDHVTQIKPDTNTPPIVKVLPEAAASQKKEPSRFPILNRIIKKSVGDDQKTFANQLLLNDPNSVIAEQFRILRSRIISFSKERNLRTILVTSAFPGEGKSTVSSNLAISIAKSINEHSLLVDCDLRRPSIHKIFDINNSNGLSSYLSNDISILQSFFKTEYDKLTIIPSGAPPENPAELISSNKMVELIDEFKNRYKDRFIIFDSTPAYHTPEPAILAKHIDGIIFIVKAGSSKRQIVKKAVDSLDRNKIIGVVFNMGQEHFKLYSYNYYYSKKQ